MSNRRKRDSKIRPDRSGALVVVISVLLVAVLVLLVGILITSTQKKTKFEPRDSTEIVSGESQSANSGSSSDASADSKKSKSEKKSSQESDSEKDDAKSSSSSSKAKSAKSAVNSLVSSYGSSISVSLMPLDGTKGFSSNGDDRFVSASMIKLIILAEFMDEVDSGKISLKSTHTLSSSEIVGGTGQMQSEGAGTSYSYDTIAKYMIMYSDNTATNILIDTLGFDAINSKASELGLGATQLNRKMMDLDSGVENYTSANDCAEILKGIANHTLASEGICEKAEGYLLAQTDSEGLAQGLPRGVKFGHKTGTLDSARHDGGIVYLDGDPYVLVTLTSLDAGTANSVMSQISSAVYDEMK